MRLFEHLALLAVLGGCPGPGKPLPPPGSVGAAPADGAAPPSTEDAREVSQEEKLAAIQKAMNELDEAAQGCWAAAAVERFDIEGEIAAIIEIEAAKSKVTLARNTTNNRKLASCLSA
nr:hypothetical protein [Deltaproteobacteria bacterium]